MFDIFRRSPVKQLKKQHEMLLTKAFQAQRNGDIRQYSLLTAEAEALREEIEAMEKQAH
ncbi:hypothetical protein GCM10007052_00500 [Halioglobus japonicus]|uniref:DUF6435 family protein n=1 Tax=Halioglobus TaxID=1217416 RepID=UPI0011AEFEA9|nr:MULTISPECIES: DUF6435 family protein [Halioglobus]GHD06125.1 hypothetical protein GCM10007052_00500 [Halioglobus japonicus]